jgi:hypothetical protein
MEARTLLPHVTSTYVPNVSDPPLVPRTRGDVRRRMPPGKPAVADAHLALQ